MIWPWQYKRKVKEYEARIAELKVAGWNAVCGWQRTIGLVKYDEYEKKVEKDYSWNREYSQFSHDKPIDGPRPDFSAYHVAGRKKE